MPGKIPIADARALSKKHNCPIVVIFAIDATGDRFNLTTYGETKALCRHAASLSEQIAEAILKHKIKPAPAEPMNQPDAPAQFESQP
jgi:hypothetical protein